MTPPDWLGTAVQALPRLVSLLSKLEPRIHLSSASEITDRFLEERRVVALLWDVDGTLMPYHDKCVAIEFRATMERLKGKVPQAVLSNCGEDRFVELGEIFPELPVLKAYRTSDGRIVSRVLERAVERWRDNSGTERSQRPAGTLSPLRKPSAELVGLALDELDVSPKERVFMVGDQYLTDIASANLAGIGSVKVPTYKRASFPLAVRSFQMLESVLYRAVHRR